MSVSVQSRRTVRFMILEVCANDGEQETFHGACPTQTYCPGGCCGQDSAEGGCEAAGAQGAEGGGGCEGSSSPILVSSLGNRLRLTDAAGGVDFDLDADGQPERLSWTAAGSEDAFLVLDRNGNGLIDDGRELFGNYTPQPESEHPNGFLALALFDAPEQGGDGDGLISASDAVFARLAYWADRNHDGVSQPEELQPLPQSSTRAIELDYRESRRRDRHGNQFRYTSFVRLAPGSPGPGRSFAVDVFLLRRQ